MKSHFGGLRDVIKKLYWPTEGALVLHEWPCCLPLQSQKDNRPLCLFENILGSKELILQLCPNCHCTGCHVQQLRLFSHVIMLMATIDIER